MIEITDKSKCCGCEACKNICPKQCIKMEEDSEGFLYPVVDKEKCINCGLCEKVCQYRNSVTEIENNENVKVYSCIIKDKEELKNSTTTAVFYNIGKYFIENEGIVYGAKYDEDMNVVHTRISKIEELESLRGSKYVQSKIGNIYTLVKQDLENKREVLFSGTPCQVGGLYKFLGKNYENLTTVDIICYGVPSPKLYRDYIKDLEEKNNSKVLHIDFRDKTYGWENAYTKIDFEDKNIKYFKPSVEDKWYQIFISHITTRRSCSNCLYTTVYRKSDITVGDFWGIKEFDNQINTYNGVAKVLINSKKGEKIFRQIQDKYVVKNRELKEAIRPNLVRPPEENTNRNKFFEEYSNNGFDKTYKKFFNNSIMHKIKRKIKKLLRKK